MTPIRRTDQHDHLGNYNINCEASKELDNDQRYFYQQGFFSRLARVLGGDQIILIEPAGELGTPGRTTFVIRTTLRMCLTIRHLTNFIIIHGVTKERSLSIPGPSHIQQRGVWSRSKYMTNVANPAPEYDSRYHGRTHLHS
jgi:hypothetical protein